MELKQFLHMNEGDGELSYFQNSFLQKGVSLMGQPMLERAIQSLLSSSSHTEGPLKALSFADLGCGVGPVPLALVSVVRETVQRECKELRRGGRSDGGGAVPEIQIYFNDLHSNDFNLLFRDLSMSVGAPKEEDGEVPLCFLMAAPGSYYGRLFPQKSLHLVHANYTLHWLSQAPPELYSIGTTMNKGNIYISETSPSCVAEAYLAQFEKDFTQFLGCRSQELLPDGRVLLTFRGRPSSSGRQTWQPWELTIFAQAILSLVSEGSIEEEKLDRFDFPYFGACEGEILDIVEREGSFEIEAVRTEAHHVAPEIQDVHERAEAIGRFMRAFSEPLISRHFGGQVMDRLYDEITCLTFEHLSSNKAAEHHTVIVLLRRK